MVWSSSITKRISPNLELGGAGAFTGVGAAILQDASPAKSGIMTGAQWAVLGTTYWCMSIDTALPHYMDLLTSVSFSADGSARIWRGREDDALQ